MNTSKFQPKPVGGVILDLFPVVREGHSGGQSRQLKSSF